MSSKKLSDVLELPIKVDVSSLTQDERGDLQRELFSVGVRWGSSKLTEVLYTEATSYFIDEGGRLSYSTSNITFSTVSDKEISIQQLKEKISMCKQFTKSDLKDGMVVKYRGGGSFASKDNGLRLVLCNQFVGRDGYGEFKEYLEDLSLSSDDTNFDIVEVFEVVDASDGLDYITSWALKSVWKREEKSQNQLEIEKIQNEMDTLKQRLEELKGKV